MRQEEDYLNRPIRSLQTMLRLIGTNQGNVSPVVPDGIYGSQTERAVRSFQRSAGLPVTGVTDLNTWEHVVQEFDRAQVQQLEASQLGIVLQPNQVIMPGERNRHLYMMQAMMKALSEVLGNMPDVEITGVHDEQSQKAVRFLKDCAKCESSAVIDRPFYARLTELYRSSVGDGTKQK